MICNVCHTRPARRKIGRGPTPQRCLECRHAVTSGRREETLDRIDQRIAARVALEACSVQRLPRNPCRCPVAVAKQEGPLTICALCSREVTP